MNYKLFNTILPKIDDAQDGRVVVTSTPKGLNNFYELYKKMANNQTILDFSKYEGAYDLDGIKQVTKNMEKDIRKTKSLPNNSDIDSSQYMEDADVRIDRGEDGWG